jgi:AcrR family transcriptional regulator
MGKVGRVPQPVNRRRYHSPVRAEAAERTRATVVAAARELFLRDGYERTSVAAVAERAGVSVDTLYAAVGRKPLLVRAVVDDVLGEGRGEVPAAARGYVEEIRAAEGARAKLLGYARAVGRLQPRLAPLVVALREAGQRDDGCREAWATLVERRAQNMRLLAADLRGTGELRADLDDDAVADIIWATNSQEYYLLLASRGWSPERYAEHLADLWVRLLLEPGPTA